MPTPPFWGSRGRRFKSGRPDWSEASCDQQSASARARPKSRRRGYGEDSVYFDAANNRWTGAVSLGFTPDGKRRIRRKVTGKTRRKFKPNLQRVKIEVPRETEGHGGGDQRLRDLIFKKIDAPAHMRLPDSRAGAMSCLTGIAARKSIDEGKPIKISDLVKFG